jgi:hypothetical protein
VSENPPKPIEKSIDSLQRIHALISALALGEAVRRLLLVPGSSEAVFNLAALPQFLALVLTIVPFYHGMHRHLEDTYLFRTSHDHPRGVLLIDFVVFLAESCTFFALASLLTSHSFYWVLLALLVFDGIWGGLTALIIKAPVYRWCVLNFVTATLMLLVLSLNVFRQGMDVWLLTVITGVRTVIDYSTHWSFYFPFSPTDETPSNTVAQAQAAQTAAQVGAAPQPVPSTGGGDIQTNGPMPGPDPVLNPVVPPHEEN